MKSDDELNALFAEHYEGLERCTCRECAGDNQPMWIPSDINDPGSKNWCMAHANPPSYTTDANAVLPWLERWGTWTCDHKLMGDAYRVELWVDTPGVGPEYGCPEPPSTEPRYKGEAPTFPRAAVIALLRAKGVEV